MEQFKNIVISKNETIKHAMELMSKSFLQMIIVIDEEYKILGTVSDGDIRRAILNNILIAEPVKKIMNEYPIVSSIGVSKDELIQLAIEKKIKIIPIVDEKYRLVKIENLYDMLQNSKKENKVVLMLGGLGTRLMPLTETVPKPMLHIGDKPIVQTIIDNFIKYGFHNFIFCVNYRSEVIEEYFGDGSKFNINIEYIKEEKRLGTAGALSLIEELNLKDTFIVMNGDIISNINIDSLFNYHLEQKGIATMCVREYSHIVPYGVIKLDENRIQNIVEKPVEKYFVNAGIYVFEPEILLQIPKNEYCDMPTLFENMILKDQPVISFPINEYWVDVGRIQDFQMANSEYGENFDV